MRSTAVAAFKALPATPFTVGWFSSAEVVARPYNIAYPPVTGTTAPDM